MRLSLPIACLFFGLSFPGASLANTESETGSGHGVEGDIFAMVTDDKESNRAFYQALGYEFVPDGIVREVDESFGAGYCARLAQRYKLDGSKARFLGLLYVAQHAIAPACYTLQPFSDELAAKRCNLMRRPVLRNDPATHTLVCGPRRPESQPSG
jgi:hypothetical protein